MDDSDVLETHSGIERPTTSAASMSIRLSCERCRLQKLKCAVPAGFDICMRCTRAKVPCLFGRRTYSKFRNRSGSKILSSTMTLPSKTPVVSPVVSESILIHVDPTFLGTNTPRKLPSESPLTPALTSPDYPSPCADWNLDSLMTGSITLLDHTVTYGLGNQQNCNLESTYESCLSFDPDFDIGFDPTTSSFTWMQDGHTLEDEDNQPVTVGQAMTSLQHSVNSVMLPTTEDPVSQKDNISAAVTNSAVGHSNISRASSQTSMQLTSLISQIQSQLRELEEGSWQKLESRTNLDDYPVRKILELSQKFGAMAGDILSTTTRPNGSGCSASSLDTSVNRWTSLPPLPLGAAVDTPTVLLVMAGYMRIMQVYNLVLDHFKQDLNDMPVNDLNQDLDKMMNRSGTNSIDKTQELSVGVLAASARLSSLSSSSSSSSALVLRPGGLLSTNTVFYLYQIHAAVKMVEDAVRDIEHSLGRDGVFARDMAVALLRSPSTRLDTLLETTATGIKELIREKFHF